MNPELVRERGEIKQAVNPRGKILPPSEKPHAKGEVWNYRGQSEDIIEKFYFLMVSREL